jgi:beta-lactamase class A
VSISEEVRAALEVLPGATGLYARNLATDEVVESNSDALLPTESAIKVLILLHYSRMVTSGAVDPDRRVALSEDFRNIKGTGVLRYLASGLELRLDDLAWLMTIVSDNVATALLMLEIGGPEAVNATASELGVSGARLSSFDELIEGAPFGHATAHDLAEAFTHLGPDAREKLARQQDLSGLPRRLPYTPYNAEVGLPTPVRVFNKTGVGPGNYIDAGLFETDDAAWVIAALASGQAPLTSRPDDPAPATFGRVGLAIYNAWGAGM